MYAIPSTPMAKPMRFALIIIKILATPPRAATCLYHGLFPNCTFTAKYKKTLFQPPTKKKMEEGKLIIPWTKGEAFGLSFRVR
jgi:hypothetical protein